MSVVKSSGMKKMTPPRLWFSPVGEHLPLLFFCLYWLGGIPEKGWYIPQAAGRSLEFPKRI